MVSDRKIAANRTNGRKSRGPRSAAGKATASRNALRHGLAAIVHRTLPDSAEIEAFAKALCGEDDDPVLVDQARVVARNDFVLRAIAAQECAVIERLREPSAIALAKGDNTVALMQARVQQGDLAYQQLGALAGSLMEKYKNELPAFPMNEVAGFLSDLDMTLPPHLLEFLEERESGGRSAAAAGIDANAPTEAAINDAACGHGRAEERDEAAAIAEAGLDLQRLERYERRAWSRQKRAIMVFGAIRQQRRSSQA
jgi:hypothetical protein